MNTLLSRLRSRNAPQASSIENPSYPLTSSALIGALNLPTAHAGVSVTEKSSLAMSSVWRAVNLIGGSAASLPLHACVRQDGVRMPADVSDLGQLIAKPHPDLTPYEVWELAWAHRLLWGNAYQRKLRNKHKKVVELWPLTPSRVKAGRADDGTKVYVVDGNTDDPLTDWEILHIPGFGYDGVVGVSPIRMAREGIGLALGAEEYAARLFGNGSLASGILQTDQRLDQDQANQLKAQWNAKARGLSKAHDVAVLDSGVKFQALTIPPEDAQFLQSREFQVTEIARWFGLPPHMLAQTEKSTSWGTGIEAQAIGFVVYTMRSDLTRFEQRITQLRPEGAREYARYSVEGLLRGDSAQRAEFYKAMWEIGVFSTNDIRQLEDLAPVDGGDVRYRPLNMGVLGAPDPIDALEALNV